MRVITAGRAADAHKIKVLRAKLMAVSTKLNLFKRKMSR
jgi:hypothetical protein